MSHLERSTRIHAPLKKVYELAHDPTRWSDWYVGISDERDLDADLGAEAGRPHRRLMVGTPFPLTQRVSEDRLGRRSAHWVSQGEGPSQSLVIDGLCRMLLLAARQEWTLKSEDGDTEVRVVLDYAIPPQLLDHPACQAILDQLEGECVEQSLANLRRLCEVTH